MRKQRLWLATLVALLGGALPALGEGPPTAAPLLDAGALAGRIDQRLAAGWQTVGLTPAAPADDSEFVRRLYLDLAGRIPRVTEVRDFLEDTRADKRERLIEKLLADPRYVSHFVNVWRALLLPEASTNIETRLTSPPFEMWLRDQLTQNTGYDRMVREILTTPISNDGLQRYFTGEAKPTPLAYYVAKEGKPENLAAGTARLFLGVRVECAQCHDHPFASWKREQFWGLAAFFAGIERQMQGDLTFPSGEKTDKRELTIPGVGTVVQATFLNGTQPKWKSKVTPRQALAEWVTAADNPYFARATVNRLWTYFFGAGLIEPVDDMVGGEVQAGRSEFLDELARQFAAHQFDLKYLIRAITLSQAYQLSSARAAGKQEDHQFAHMTVRGMTAEQLYDSLEEATGFKDPTPTNDIRSLILGTNSPRNEFLTKFSTRSDKAIESQTSILQALTLMNGKIISDATSLEKSRTLAAVLDAPFLTTEERIESLYLATLSRKPKPKELDRLVKYIESHSATEERKDPAEKEKSYQRAMADVLWALLNSAEFVVNH
jgi:hypothetical protein